MSGLSRMDPDWLYAKCVQSHIEETESRIQIYIRKVNIQRKKMKIKGDKLEEYLIQQLKQFKCLT